jgi:type II secretion system (T2SS) protein E
MSSDPLLGAPIAGPGSGAPLAGPGVTPPSLSGAGSRFLSDILVELGFVPESQAEEAVQTARNPGQPTPEKVLLKSGAISEDQLARALAERYGLEHIDLSEFAVDTSAAGLLRKSAAKRYLAAPVGFADDGALVLAVADPGDALGLSDIAVMTKLAVRPAVAARSQIVKLLDTLVFMEEPAPGEGRSVSTVIVPPEEKAAREPPEADVGEPVLVEGVTAPTQADEASERELARLREELALALMERDQAQAEAASTGKHAESGAQREREEALEALRAEHERVLAASEHAAEESLRAERASAQQALASLRAKQDEATAELRAEHEAAVAELKAAHEQTVDALKAAHDEELTAERARRVEEVEAERARTAAAIDTERERNAKELEALRLRGEEAIAEERARLEAELESARESAAAVSPEDAERVKRLERELSTAREQVELTADADRRAEAARAALSALRDESERQAQVHALTERELRAEIESLRAELPEPSQK